MAKKSSQKTTTTTKQKSVQEQIRESIVNSQVRQAMINNGQDPDGFQNLKQEYERWNAVQDLQKEYDAWNKKQSGGSQSKAGKLIVENKPFMTAEERKAYKEQTTIKDPITPTDYEKSYKARQLYKKEKEAKDEARAIMRGEIPASKTNELPVLQKVTDRTLRGSRLADYANSDIAKAEKAVRDREASQAALQNQFYPEQKQDIGLSVLGNNKFDALEMPQYQPKGMPNKSSYSIDNSFGVNQLSNLGDYIDKLGSSEPATYDNMALANMWLDPEYKLSKAEEEQAKTIINDELKQLRGKKLADMTPEERERLDTFQALKTKISNLQSFAIGAGKAVLKAGQGLGDLILNAGQANAPTSGALDIQRENLKNYRNKVNETNEGIADVVENAKTQNPLAYGGGQFAGNAGMYMTTNPLFDSVAKLAGASEVGRFLLNQIGQAGQDAVLDIYPTLVEMMADGELTKEEINTLVQMGASDVSGNVLMDVGGHALSELAVKVLSKLAARNAVKGATGSELPTLLKNADNASKASEIPGLNTAEDITNDINRQFSEAMNRYNTEFKDNSAMKNVYSADDLEGSLSNQLENALKDRTEALRRGYNYDYKGVPVEYTDSFPEPEKLVHELTGRQVSPEYAAAVRKLEDGKSITTQEYNAIDEIKEAKRRVAEAGDATYLDNSPERIRKRDQWLEALHDNSGSAVDTVVDGKHETVYNGVVRRDKRADIILGLPSSGKSSAIVDPISYKYKSRLIDSDEAKKLIDEFDNGWGAGRVHVESGDIADRLLARAVLDGENVVIPKVGGKYQSIANLIDELKSNGYTVNLHFNELDPNKAAGRNMRRFATDGRFLDLDDTSFRYGNTPSEVFERLVKEGKVDGYTRVSNDVRKGEFPVQLRGTEDISFDWRNNRPSGSQYSKELGEVYSGRAPETSITENSTSYWRNNGQSGRISGADSGAASSGVQSTQAGSFGSDTAPLRNDFELPSETFNKIDSEAIELARPINKVKNSGIMNNVTDEKALLEWQNLNDAYSDYIMKAQFSDNLEEVEAAKRVLDNTRKRYATAMKNIDSDISASFNNKKYGDTIGRPLNERKGNVKKSSKRSEEIADLILQNEAELKGQTQPESVDALWDELKAGEQASDNQLKMDLTRFQEKTSRADEMLYDIKYGDDSAGNANGRVSDFYNNSMQRNKYAWDEEDLSGLYDAKQFEYLPTQEKTSLKNAFDNVTANKDALIDRYTKQADTLKKGKEKTKFYNAQDVDQMHLLIRDLRNKERHAADEATRALYAQQRLEITKHLYDATHSSAAVMQAGQKWLNDVEGILDSAEAIRLKKMASAMDDNPNLQKAVNDVADDIYKRFKELEKNNALIDMSAAERRAKVREMIEDALSNSEVKRRLGQEDVDKIVDNLMKTRTADSVIEGIEDALSVSGSIKPETIDKVYDIWAQIETLDPGSKEFRKGTKEMYKLLANDIGGSGTFWDKVDAWRYFAMLANPTTHIRNILGNVTMNGMTGVKNNIAAAMEEVADAATKKKGGIQGGRTKAFLGLKESDRNLVKQSANYFDNHAYGEFVEGGNRYLSASQGIDDAIPTFKNKALDNVVGGHSDILTAEDIAFGKAKYQTSLAGYLKANGADASIFNATDSASKELLEKAHKYALEMANEATFHTENAAANALSQFTKNLKESNSPMAKALGVMIDTTVPFKKTPINILKNCFEYSPLEFAKVIMDIGKWKKGVISTSTMIDNLSKAITGTGGMLLGALLAHEGIVKVTSGNTNKEQAYDKQSGQQAIALNVFGHDIDLSFLPPSVMPLIMGATLLNDYQEKYGDEYTALDVLTGAFTDPEILANTALESLDTIVDTTMLSGIDDLISTIRYSESPQDVVKSLATKTATNFAGQLIPTLLKKTANVIDGQKYSSYSDKKGAAKTLDSSLKYLKTTIPGLQQLGRKMEQSGNQTIASLGDAITAEPKINGWGEEVYNEDYGLGIGGRAIDQYLNPATTTKNTDDEVTKEIRALSERLSDDSVLDIGSIPTSESSFSINNEKFKLDEKQWTQYSKIEGQTARALAESYVGSKAWNEDSDEERARKLSEMKDFAKSYARSQVVDRELSKVNQKISDIYNDPKQGKQGVIDYFNNVNLLKDVGLDNTDKNYEMASTKGQAYVENYAQENETLKKYGIDTSNETARKLLQTKGEDWVKNYGELKSKAKDQDLGSLTANEAETLIKTTASIPANQRAEYYSFLMPSTSPGANPFGYVAGANYDSSKDKSYQAAKSIIPSLSPEKYYKTKDDIDADGNGSIKQDELYQYFQNNSSLSDTYINQLWEAYGGYTNKKGEKKKLIKNSDGTYTSKY